VTSLAPGELPALLLSLGVLLATTRVCGAFAKRIGQPSVLGELVAGVLLGPTLFGRVAPELHAYLYPGTGGQAVRSRY
jgi:Kef-type K+ transport system membrane component KefB